MSKLLILLVSALFVGVCFAASAACPRPSPTHTWKISCTNMTNAPSSCFEPEGMPSETSVVLFPSGATVTLHATIGAHFNLWTFKSVVVDTNATLIMDGDAIQVLECFIVEGKLSMIHTAPNSGAQAPMISQAYRKDPAQPMGTDCTNVTIGFVPRICGPGIMRVVGTVEMKDYYSSLWLATSIESTGTLRADTGSFLWGTVSNYGILNLTGLVYVHGFIYNYASAAIMCLVFDKWALTYKPSSPILIENHGSMRFGMHLVHNHLHTTQARYGENNYGEYKAVLLNYNNVSFGNSGVDTQLDMFNYGNVQFETIGNDRITWHGVGHFVNQGTFECSSSNVYLSQYFGSPSAKLIHHGGCQFNFGHGMPASPLVICPVKREVIDRLRGNSGYWCRGSWYSYPPFCYPHYVPTVKRVKLEDLPVQKPSMLFTVAQQLDESNVDFATLCSEQYSMDGGIIEGDGSGGVVSTIPVTISGEITVGRGARWVMLAENGASPFHGQGVIKIAKFGEVHVGIDATLEEHGSFIVEAGGLLSVPLHAHVSLNNYTIDIRRGGVLHVDGFFRQTTHQAQLRQCGTLRGSGRVVLADNADVSDILKC